MPRRLAQQRMTLSDLELPFHGSSVPYALAFGRGVLMSMRCAHRPHQNQHHPHRALSLRQLSFLYWFFTNPDFQWISFRWISFCTMWLMWWRSCVVFRQIVNCLVQSGSGLVRSDSWILWPAIQHQGMIATWRQNLRRLAASFAFPSFYIIIWCDKHALLCSFFTLASSHFCKKTFRSFWCSDIL